jgi:hypothetical protein
MVARNECMELVLAPSLEGVAVIKRRSTLKKKKTLQRSNSRNALANVNPSRSRTPDRNAAFHENKISYSDF